MNANGLLLLNIESLSCTTKSFFVILVSCHAQILETFALAQNLAAGPRVRDGTVERNGNRIELIGIQLNRMETTYFFGRVTATSK